MCQTSKRCPLIYVPSLPSSVCTSNHMYPLLLPSQADAKSPLCASPHPMLHSFPLSRSETPLSSPSVLRLADSTDWSILILGELLREELLPDLEPLLLLRGWQLARLFEGTGEELAQACAKDFHDEHCFPVREGEAAAVAVKNYNAGEHLGWIVSRALARN